VKFEDHRHVAADKRLEQTVYALLALSVVRRHEPLWRFGEVRPQGVLSIALGSTERLLLL
jgi:hypothetical protein